VQVGADGDGGVGVYGAVAFLDVADDAFLIDDDIGALRPLVRLLLNVVVLQDAVTGEHFLAHVAEQREVNVDLLGEGGVGSGRIHANAENSRIRGIDLA
jgi:hypothetical protein